MSDFIQQFLDAPRTQEALGWLRAASDTSFRSVGDLETTEESISLIELIYKAGATKVLAVEIDEFPEGQNTGRLVIQLPDNEAKRTRILEWASTLAQQQGVEPELDSEKRLLFLTLD